MKHIVYIDDQTYICTNLEKLFESDNFILNTFVNSDIALDFISQEQKNISCIFVDYRMPGLNGLELSAYFPKVIPVILVGGNLNVQAFPLNIKGVLNKPFDEDDLLKIADSFTAKEL